MTDCAETVATIAAWVEQVRVHATFILRHGSRFHCVCKIVQDAAEAIHGKADLLLQALTAPAISRKCVASTGHQIELAAITIVDEFQYWRCGLCCECSMQAAEDIGSLCRRIAQTVPQLRFTEGEAGCS